jgi:hypothetical protein
MKLFPLLLLLMIVACGKVSQKTAVLGDTQKFEPITPDNSTLSQMQSICSAIAYKTQFLDSNTNVYTFDFSQKSCTDSNLGPSAPVAVTIIRNLTNYNFRKSDGSLFGFDVESSTTGVMGTICSTITSLKNQILTSDNVLIGIATTGISAADCSPNANEVCLYISKASPGTTTGEYIVHTKEWLRFKVANDKTGFYLERKRISQSDCAPNQQTIQKAVLR